VVAVIALFFSAKSANAAEASAQASENYSITAGQQHALELARDGIVEFGPWRAESSDSLNWRFINLGETPLYALRVHGGEYTWDVGISADGVAQFEEATVRMAAGAQGPLAHRVTVFWREGSADGPESSEVVYLRRKGRRLCP
jgi:hypothetical protein